MIITSRQGSLQPYSRTLKAVAWRLFDLVIAFLGSGAITVSLNDFANIKVGSWQWAILFAVYVITNVARTYVQEQTYTVPATEIPVPPVTPVSTIDTPNSPVS